MPTCTSCGQDNPDGARFCNACAAPLEAALPAREVRKVVTVLFADVVGSTPLGERLDPESLRRVMARWFEEARTVLERHGGSVEKFIGDAVMAVFGVPQVHEDDALRAARAAAELREALVDLNDELERDYGVRVDVRTGVNTGEVVTGTDERLATGDAVNVAARLEAEARPGEILIGDETYRLVRDAAETEAVGPLALRGKEAKLTARRLLGVLPGVAGVARRLDSPLVGRERERRLLADAFERAVEDRACQLFTVLGSAGVGKSRLIEEFAAGIAEQAVIVRGRCLPYGDGITFWPVAEILHELPPVMEVFSSPEEGAIVAERLGAAVGGRPAGRTEEIFLAMRKLLEELALTRPVVALFDDLHWAEPTLLDLLEHVSDLSRDAPILLVCMARPELLEVRAGWSGGKLNATTVLLEPLRDQESGLLIDNLLGRASLAEPVRDRIADAAEGNPLFVEQLLEMLIDEGRLARENGFWVPEGDLDSLTVPPTIRALLAARIDRLDLDERSVLECAAVEGKAFHRGAVAHLTPERLEPTAVGLHLTALVRKELIRPRPADFPGEDGFRFRHILIRDAAYEALPKEARSELHERFAAWLDQRTSRADNAYAEIVGYHLEQAYRFRAELGPPDDETRELGRRGAVLLAAAGRRASARFDLPAAENLLSRAIELLPESDPLRRELMVDLGIALTAQGELARADEVLLEARDMAREAADQKIEFFARVHRAYCVAIMAPEAWFSEARNEAGTAVAAFEELGDEAGLAHALHLAALLEFWGGHPSAAEEIWERAVAHALSAGDERQAMESLPWLNGATFYGERPAPQAERRIAELIEQAGGDWRIDAWATVTRGALAAMQGRIDEGRACSEHGRSLFTDLGLRVELTWSSHFFAYVEILGGDLAAAEAELRQGYEISKEISETGYLSTTAAMLADVVYEQGRYEEALRLTEESEATGAPDDELTQILWRATRAKILARLGDPDAGETLAGAALERVRTTEYLVETADTLRAYAETLRAGGRDAQAAAALREALELYVRKGNLVMAGRVRELLAGGDGHR